MAGISKTYCTPEQYKIAYRWYQEMIQKMKDELGEKYIRIFEDDWSIPEQKNLWNNSYIQDYWLMKNCDIDFIVDGLKIGYGEDIYNLAQRFDFKKDPCLLMYIEGDSSVNFMDESGVQINEILLYGTPLLMKLIHDAEYLKRWKEISSNMEIGIKVFGVNLTLNNTGKMTDGEKIYNTLPLGNTPMKYPSIKHSYNIKDAETIPLNRIFISNDSEVFSLSDVDKFEHQIIRKLKDYLPNYLKKWIQ